LIFSNFLKDLTKKREIEKLMISVYLREVTLWNWKYIYFPRDAVLCVRQSTMRTIHTPLSPLFHFPHFPTASRNMRREGKCHNFNGWWCSAV